MPTTNKAPRGYLPDEHVDEAEWFTESYAKSLDSIHPLRKFREEFVIPTVADLKRRSIIRPTENSEDQTQCVYLCGNSLGCQPKAVSKYVKAQLDTWAAQGVFGHFNGLDDSPLSSWTQMDEAVAKSFCDIVGAKASEIAIMQTLTANLHLLLASFYQPTKEKYKIILEGKAFPSDHYAIQSHIEHRGISSSDAMVLLTSSNPRKDPCLQTSAIIEAIDKHADSTALILLPGIQYYTGQFLDMETITKHARSRGITIGWDLAHAVGNMPLQLHDWDADFAVWCTYKYLNCGPGAIGGMFVHERHGTVNLEKGLEGYHPRLAGWWGGDKKTRFNMDDTFIPISGASGWQLSNPSALDLSSVMASLSVFAKTSVKDLRHKSIQLTGYLEHLLLHDAPNMPEQPKPYSIITPAAHDERGAQLSILLEPGLLESVFHELEDNGVVVDERKPDVIRVAPAPLYNNYHDVWQFVRIFKRACGNALQKRGTMTNGIK